MDWDVSGDSWTFDKSLEFVCVCVCVCVYVLERKKVNTLTGLFRNFYCVVKNWYLATK